MANVTLSGVIKKINQTETVGTKDFKKRSFILTEQKDSYPSVWMLEVQKDFCSELDKYEPGDSVSCEVEITGRAWEEKAFNTLKAYRISLVKKGEAVGSKDGIPPADDSDIPF